jgi:hypothetical protein
VIEVPLSQGAIALIDDVDGDAILAHKWSLNAGRWGSPGYAVRNSAGGMLQMHRVILGAPPGVEVDHRNGNGLDNRRGNLRLATASQNAANRPKTHGRFSEFKGIVWVRGAMRWQAQLHLNGKTIRGRLVTSREEAARGYDDLARQHFGEFACLNFPAENERGALKRRA